MADPTGSMIQGFFGSDKMNRLKYNEGADKNLDSIAGTFGGDNTKAQGFLDQYGNANTSRIANVNKIAGNQANQYQGMLGKMANYNPLDTYGNLRTGNLNALKSWSGILGQQGTRDQNMALAAMGMGGRPGGAYSQALTADRVSRNMAPVIGGVMSNLGNDTNMIGNQMTQNWGNMANAMGGQMGTAFASNGMELNPLNALMALRGQQIGQQGDIINGAKANTAGWQKENNWADRLGTGLNAANDATWQNVGNAMKVYSSLESGGMLGGGGGGGGMGGMMGGGGGGGGGGNGLSTGGWNGYNTMMPSNTGYFQAPGGYGYASNNWGNYMSGPGGQFGMQRSPSQQASYDSIASQFQ